MPRRSSRRPAVRRIASQAHILLLAVACIPGTGTRARADELAALHPRLEVSTVSIMAYQPGRKVVAQRYDILGTGCFVTTDGHVLTADHVVQAIVQPEGHVRRGPALDRLAIGRIADPAQPEVTILASERGMAIRIVHRDPARDLALIHVQVDDAPPVTFARDEAPVGAVVGILGFPFGSNLGYRPLLNRAGIAGRRHLPGRTEGANHVRGYILDGSVHPGHSGAPVFDAASGLVVGLVQRRIRETIPVAIGSGELIAFCKSAGITPLTRALP